MVDVHGVVTCSRADAAVAVNWPLARARPNPRLPKTRERRRREGFGEHGHGERKLSGAPTRVAVTKMARRPLPWLELRR